MMMTKSKRQADFVFNLQQTVNLVQSESAYHLMITKKSLHLGNGKREPAVIIYIYAQRATSSIDPCRYGHDR